MTMLSDGRGERIAVRLLGGAAGVLAAQLPFAAIVMAARIGLIPESVVIQLGPWITFGLPIGAVAGFLAGVLLAPAAWQPAWLGWWLAGAVSWVAWVVGLGLAAAWGFAAGSGGVGNRALLAGVLVLAAFPMLLGAVPAAVSWVALMRLASRLARPAEDGARAPGSGCVNGGRVPPRPSR